MDMTLISDTHGIVSEIVPLYAIALIIFVILAAIRHAIFGEEKFTTIDVAQA